MSTDQTPPPLEWGSRDSTWVRVEFEDDAGKRDREQLAELRQALTEAEANHQAEIGRLRREFSARRIKLMNHIADGEAERDAMRQELHAQATSLEANTAAMARATAHVDQLTAEIARLRAELDEARRQFPWTFGELVVVRAERDALRAADDSFRTLAAKDQDHERHRLAAEAQQLEVERDALAARLAAAEQVVEAASAMADDWDRPETLPRHERAIIAAVDAYRANRAEAP